VATVWARIEPISGREGDLDRDIRAEIDTRIRLYYSPLTAALTAVDRIRYRERIYNIVSAFDVDSAHVEIQVEARSGLNDG
jgi:head-tail adaptor